MKVTNKKEKCFKRLVATAPAKINLHLEVLGTRTDGFHELAMVMQSIALVDKLEIKSTDKAGIKLSCDEPSLPTDENNLIVRAGQLLLENSGVKGLGAEIYLQKQIPIGAGLAGGSSNGAATLVGLNVLWGLDYPLTRLEEFASELGSDMAFCLKGGTQLSFGRGERLECLPELKKPMAVILVKNPLVSVSTPWAYGLCKKVFGDQYLTSEKDFEERRNALRSSPWLHSLGDIQIPQLRNDLQQVVAPETKAVRDALSLLRGLPGSLAVSMSGSGPSCFALYPDFSSASSVLDENQDEFEAAGLETWCCSLVSEGVKIVL